MPAGWAALYRQSYQDVKPVAVAAAATAVAAAAVAAAAAGVAAADAVPIRVCQGSEKSRCSAESSRINNPTSAAQAGSHQDSSPLSIQRWRRRYANVAAAFAAAAVAAVAAAAAAGVYLGCISTSFVSSRRENR